MSRSLHDGVFPREKHLCPTCSGCFNDTLEGMSQCLCRHRVFAGWEFCEEPWSLRDSFKDLVPLAVGNRDIDIAEILAISRRKDELDIIPFTHILECLTLVHSDPTAQIRNPCIRLGLWQVSRHGSSATHGYTGKEDPKESAGHTIALVHDYNLLTV